MCIPCFFVKLNFFFILTWLKLVFTCDFFSHDVIEFCIIMSPLASLHVVLSYILQLKATKHFSIVKARIIQDGTVIYGLWCCCLFQYGGVLMLVLLLLVGGSVMGFMLKGKVSLVGSIESRGTMVCGLWWYSNTCLLRILCNLFHSVIRFWYIPLLQIP